MKFIITDNIRVANMTNLVKIKKPSKYIGKRISVLLDSCQTSVSRVTNITWAAQDIVVFTVEELGYYTPLQKQVLKASASEGPDQIKAVRYLGSFLK